jgi:serine/threonine protein kinase
MANDLGNPADRRAPTPETAPTAANHGGASSSVLGAIASGPDGDFETHPKQIGHYKIIRKLGKGGMGVVLLGVRDDDQFHKRVAIKIIRRGIDSASDGKEVLKRFDLERQVLGALNHPNIARLIDAGQLPEPDGRPYFVMEYVEGEPIDEYCDRMQLTTEQRLELFRKVCAAVHHAHQNLVVHRDIKPGNVLVDVNNEPKLMDFGIAKLLNPAMAAVTLATSWDRGPMTPEYASPEQIQGKPVSTASDVYALGVLMYELLTGRRPYRVKSRIQSAIEDAILNQEPERPSTIVTQEVTLETDGQTRTVTAEAFAKPREGAVTRLKRKLAGDVDNIVLMAMRKSPQRRYPSAEALAADIQRHLEGEPVQAAPDSVIYRAGKFVKRNRAGVLAAALVLLAIVGGGVVATVQWQRADEARRSERAARERAERLLGAVRKFGEAYTKELPRIIGSLEDSTPALRALADAAIAGLGDLRTEFAGDLAMQRQVANAYALAGRIRAGMRGGTETDGPEGLRLLDEALKVRRAVVSQAPDDKAARMELASTLVYRGDALRLQGRNDEGKRDQAEALRVVEEIGDKEVDDPIVARLYAVALVSRADALKGEGKLDDAGLLLQKSAAIREHLAKGLDRDVARQRDLTIGLNRLALWHKARGELDKALPLFKKAYDIRERSLGIDRNARTMRDVAIAGSAYAMALLEQSPPDTETAEPVLAHALDLITNLNCSDSSSSRTISDTVRAYADMGVLRAAQGAPEDAATSLTRAIDFGSPHAASGKDLVLAQEMMRACELRGDTKRTLKDLSGARADYEQALKYAAQLGPELEGIADIQARLHKSIAELKTDR